MQSIVKQATDIQYQYPQNCQKLNPELKTERQRILKADQRLKHQIIYLEGHFQNLEINKFEEQYDGAGRRHPSNYKMQGNCSSCRAFTVLCTHP